MLKLRSGVLWNTLLFKTKLYLTLFQGPCHWNNILLPTAKRPKNFFFCHLQPSDRLPYVCSFFFTCSQNNEGLIDEFLHWCLFLLVFFHLCRETRLLVLGHLPHKTRVAWLQSLTRQTTLKVLLSLNIKHFTKMCLAQSYKTYQVNKSTLDLCCFLTSLSVKSSCIWCLSYFIYMNFVKQFW